MELEDIKDAFLEQARFRIAYYKNVYNFKVSIVLNNQETHNKKLTDILYNSLQSYEPEFISNLFTRHKVYKDDMNNNYLFNNFDDFYKAYSGILEEIGVMKKYPESHHMLL